MKFSEFRKSMSPLEMILLVVFIIYLVFPIKTPEFLAGSIDSPFGLIGIFAVTLYLFFFANPIIGVIYIFVAYELIRRSAITPQGIAASQYAIQQYTPTQAVKDVQLQKMNPRQSETLEEEMISIMAPASRDFIKGESVSNFKPVADSVIGASMV